MSVHEAPIGLQLPVTEAERRVKQSAREVVAAHASTLVLGAVAILALAWTFAPVVIVAIDAARHHRLFLGIAGMWPMDQLQYLSWATDAGAHGLIRNLYGFGGGAVFVHPLWTATGLVQAATGASPVLALLFWQFVSVGLMVAGCARLVWRRLGPSGLARRTSALLLCVFGGLTPLVAALPLMDPWAYSSDYLNAAGGVLSGTPLWGYAPLAIALGLMPFAIDDVERILSGAARRSTWMRASGLGLVVSWLHPWQGEELLLIAAGLALWQWSGWRRRSLCELAAFAVATALPLLYYLALSHIDIGWRTSAHDSVGGSIIPFSVIATCMAPLVVVFLLALNRVKVDRGARALVLWPLAVLVTVLLTPNGQYRAVAGIALPMAILVVRAWPTYATWRRRSLMAGIGILAGLGPSVPYLITTLKQVNSPSNRAYAELRPSDVRAADFAARHTGGRPILAPVALGTAIPALTDARVWVGHPIWTPNHLYRGRVAEALFIGEFKAARARAFVSATGARVLVQPCGYKGRLRTELAPLGFRETRIGCARVYTASS